MPTIQCKATIFTPDPSEELGSEPLLTLPREASLQLPSRGMTMIKGTMNGTPFSAVIEPDGIGSHWFRVSKTLLNTAQVEVGDTVTLEIESSKDWPEPKVPADLQKALNTDEKARALWTKITPMARWDWIRWIGSTKNPETRQRRVEVSCSKLRSGERRPCCFNRAQRTLTDA